MNIKDLFLSLVMALGITLLFQYLFFNKSEDKQVSVERVRVMPKTDVYRPLDIEIDFWDKEFNIKPVVTQVETDFAHYSFSNEGAALIKADFKHVSGGKAILLPGIKSNGRIDRSFLLAFNKKTPYYFELVSHQQLSDATKLEYKAAFDGGSLIKTFTVYKAKPQVDLHISFEPNALLAEPYRLRLVYDVPSILHAASLDEVQTLQMQDDLLFGIVDIAGKVVRKPVIGLLDRYWEDPVNFGGMDKYLVSTTINNNTNFAQRAYYNLYSDRLLRAYLESPEIKDKTEWNVSFYLGPKQDSAFEKVDSKLDQLLDFGILAPLSKLLLRILNFFYGFVGNFGLAIILLTLLIKIVTLPLSLSTEKNIKNVAEMNRKKEYLNQKYKNNPAELAAANAELMRKYGLGMFGCLLPVLIQAPVFFALRAVLTTSLELYMSPFLWINNLVAADQYCILPLFFAICMFVKMSANNKDPRKKLSSLGWSVFMGACFAYFSAGLVLYFLVSTLLDMLQSNLYNRFGKA